MALVFAAGLCICGCGRDETSSAARTNAAPLRASSPQESESERLGKPPKTRAIRDLPSWVTVPGGISSLGSREPGAPPPRDVPIASFWMTRTEITTAQFARFLNDTNRRFNSPQFAGAPGRYAPRAAREPVAYVSYNDAVDYAAWLAERLDADVRLPTADEWEHAARGGVFAATYPWGWASAAGQAAFRLTRPRPVGSYPPNRYKLYDMAGNVAEWCAAESDAASAPICGGSWSERSESMLAVWRRIPLPRGYRDADVGFRVIARPRRQ
jgi:formylglycine-generating enzyme required for sulfatase activity